MSEYRLVVVPDIITPAGEVRHWTLYQKILHDRLHKTFEEAAMLTEIAREGSRCFTPAEQDRWNQLMGVIIQLNKRLAQFSLSAG